MQFSFHEINVNGQKVARKSDFERDFWSLFVKYTMSKQGEGQKEIIHRSLADLL